MAAAPQDSKIVQPQGPSRVEDGPSGGVAESIFDQDDVDDEEKRGELGAEAPSTWTREEERKALRKLDWNLIPLWVYHACFEESFTSADSRTGRLGALYLVSYIDRGNIGNAYTAGMGSEWGITSDDYAWVVTTLYIGYIAFHWVGPTSPTANALL